MLGMFLGPNVVAVHLYVAFIPIPILIFRLADSPEVPWARLIGISLMHLETLSVRVGLCTISFGR